MKLWLYRICILKVKLCCYFRSKGLTNACHVCVSLDNGCGIGYCCCFNAIQKVKEWFVVCFLFAFFPLFFLQCLLRKFIYGLFLGLEVLRLAVIMFSLLHLFPLHCCICDHKYWLQVEQKKQSAADVTFQYSNFVMACIGFQARPCDMRLHLMKVLQITVVIVYFRSKWFLSRGCNLQAVAKSACK